MRELDDVRDLLAYHPATQDVAPKFAAIRRLGISLAEEAWDLIPPGPEKTLAMRGIQDFVMHANCAIAMTTPADLITSDVARVMPPEGASGEPGDGREEQGDTQPSL